MTSGERWTLTCPAVERVKRELDLVRGPRGPLSEDERFTILTALLELQAPEIGLTWWRAARNISVTRDGMTLWQALSAINQEYAGPDVSDEDEVEYRFHKHDAPRRDDVVRAIEFVAH